MHSPPLAHTPSLPKLSVACTSDTSQVKKKSFWYGRLSEEMAEMMGNLKPELRRLFMASFTKHLKTAMERVLGIMISNYKWTEARKHAVYPGPFCPTEKTAANTVFWSKVNYDLVQKKFCTFLKRAGILQ